MRRELSIVFPVYNVEKLYRTVYQKCYRPGKQIMLSFIW